MHQTQAIFISEAFFLLTYIAFKRTPLALMNLIFFCYNLNCGLLPCCCIHIKRYTFST